MKSVFIQKMFRSPFPGMLLAGGTPGGRLTSITRLLVKKKYRHGWPVVLGATVNLRA